MSVRIIRCAKLDQDLPAIDVDSPEGSRSLKMVTLIAGPEFAARVRERISAQALRQWNDHMLMVMNEYRLDATSDESNKILSKFMEQFFFGDEQAIPNFVPPKS